MHCWQSMTLVTEAPRNLRNFAAACCPYAVTYVTYPTMYALKDSSFRVACWSPRGLLVLGVRATVTTL